MRAVALEHQVHATVADRQPADRHAVDAERQLRPMHADLAGASVHVTRADGSKDPGVAVTAVDHEAQEDAWRYDWAADGTSSIAFVPPEALDLGRETNGDVLLLLTLRLATAPSADTALFVECGDKCGARVPVGSQFAALPRDTWMRVGIPLKCFAAGGADMVRLAAIGVESKAGFALAISEVGYGTVADQVLACGQSGQAGE